LIVALTAIGCGGALPLSSEAPSTPVAVTQQKVAPSKSCAVHDVMLSVEPSDLYRHAYRIEASYVVATEEARCVAPAWTLIGREGQIIATKNPYVVHVQAKRDGARVTVTAAAANGRSASADLKF
jgi:hypothetical protein